MSTPQITGAAADDREARAAAPATIDNRITLPLDRARTAAAQLCRLICMRRWNGHHEDACLQPHIDQRDRMVAEDLAVRYADGRTTPDCRDGKHVACTGCLCDCHRHSRRTP